MNPQYLPPGQNNNAPNNPIGYPPVSSQDFNGHQNANFYQQMPPNGPTSQMMPLMKPLDQAEMAQKMQNMNLNGAQSFPGQISQGQIPPGQLPPGAMPQPGQLPPNQRPTAGPPGSGGQMPPTQQYSSMPQPTSTPGPVPTSQHFNQTASQQGLGEQTHSRPLMPPAQGPPSMQSNKLSQPSMQQPGPKAPGPPTSQSNQLTGMPPSGQFTPQNAISGQMPGQPGQIPPQSGQIQSHPGQGPPQSLMSHSQPGMPPTSQGPQQPGFQQSRQPGMPQSGQMPVGSGQLPVQAQPPPPGPPMAGLPHMPPPISQQQGRQFQGMVPPGNQPPAMHSQQGLAKPPMLPPNAGYPGMTYYNYIICLTPCSFVPFCL